MVNSMTRFLAVDSTKVDLKERKDKLNNSKTEYLSLDDIRGYKVYTALLTQSGTDAPLATVLENTLNGDISFLYSDVGEYNVLSDNLFINQKTSIEITQTGNNSYSYVEYSDESNFYIFTRNISDQLPTNSLLNNSKLEIRVYN